MIILVMNCGSSSVKFRVYDVSKTQNRLLARGGADRVGMKPGSVEIRSEGKPPFQKDVELVNPQAAIAMILNELLLDPEHGCITDIGVIDAIGHRVVHGGEHFSAATLIKPEVKAAIKECATFAPLHNPANLDGIWACERLLPDVPQVAVFDTAFHSTLAPEAYMYALPRRLYTEYGIRRYGFHGTSHFFVNKEAEGILKKQGKASEPYRIITCHLGNGASLAAVKGGKCLDTSMGFTPLEGLVMGTRCGDIDPAILMHLGQFYGPARLDKMLNKESGIMGLTGYSDMRDVVAAARFEEVTEGLDEEERSRVDIAREAMCIYSRRIKKYIGSYAAVLGGVDAVVFTAGVGENSPDIRAHVLEGMEWLGLEVDNEANLGNQTIITTKDSEALALVVPTNEELVIARQTCRVVGESGGK